MKYNNTTLHAKKRMQQRAINALQIKLIETFGEFQYQKGGSYYAYIPEKTLAELRNAIDRLKDVRAIYGDKDSLVTVMHETKQVKKTRYVA